MRLVFAVFGLLLILTGAVLVMVPREQPQPTRSMSTQQVVSLAVRARDIADQVNGPLSILFGLISLYYSRKRYIVARDKNGDDRDA